VEQENSDTTKQLEGSINTDGPLRKQDATNFKTDAVGDDSA